MRRLTPFRIDDLPAGEIMAALSVDLDELPPEEACAVRDFIERIGGRRNACLAAEVLETLEEDDP